MGSIDFKVRTQDIKALVVPYRHFQLQRVHRMFDAYDERSQCQVKRLLNACGMTEILNIRLKRQIDRSHNLEVWLD